MAINPVSLGSTETATPSTAAAGASATPGTVPQSELPNAAQLELSSLVSGLFGSSSASASGSSSDPVLDALLNMDGSTSPQQAESDSLLTLLDDLTPQSFANQQALSAYGTAMSQGNGAPAA
ncbi:MAG: hypothetical protein JO247_16640 [Chloroflexi bacterium]|nr:hypothetical protein [Chloroflexota bacterium]